ncbi:hypothetical protein [Curvivirga sp.]|uniref:hypothetical protein n=1 Tax=Curvivirga sp. TaxID=2856848 RepID=UPI003B5CFDB4
MVFDEKTLLSLNEAPVDKEEFNEWLWQKDVIPNLKKSLSGEEVILYAGFGYYYTHTVLVPEDLLNPPDFDDLMRWHFNPYESWDLWQHMGDEDCHLEDPMSRQGETLPHGEQLVFLRTFEGVPDLGNYVELSQRFMHVMGLHYIKARQAWCSLDDNGDLKDIVKVVQIRGEDDFESGMAVICDSHVIRKYAEITGSSLVTMFDLTRCENPYLIEHGVEEVSYCGIDRSFVTRFTIRPTNCSASRGVIVTKLQEMHFSNDDNGTKEYASFIARDLRRNEIKEISCAPDSIVNYFTESTLPYEMSPAFFNPEVLLKYKNDSEKYRLEDRSIHCRGGWFIQSYDINEHGQVHVYLIDLQRLPYAEQLYWKSFNEKPKGGISERAFATDFEGKFFTSYCPLVDIKNILKQFEKSDLGWWKCRDESLYQSVRYPVTASIKEWSNELLNLCQLIVDGIDKKWLKKQLKNLDHEYDPSFGSIGMTTELLNAYGMDQEDARETTRPIAKLQRLRSTHKGHANEKDADKERKQILENYGDLSTHFREVSMECEEALSSIFELFSYRK